MNSLLKWRVLVPKRVVKTLNRFPKADRERVFQVLQELEHNPWDGDIAKIKNKSNSWRRRAGNYRIFFTLNQNQKSVEVKEVERRTSSTY